MLRASLGLSFLLMSAGAGRSARAATFRDACATAMEGFTLRTPPVPPAMVAVRLGAETFYLYPPFAKLESLADSHEKAALLKSLAALTSQIPEAQSRAGLMGQDRLNHLLRFLDHWPAQVPDRLVVAVHQSLELQERTARFMGEQLPDVPLLLYTSPFFPTASQALLRRANAIRFSIHGEKALPSAIPSSVRDFYFLGGFCGQCLNNAMTDIAAGLDFKSLGAGFTFQVVSSLSYTRANTLIEGLPLVSSQDWRHWLPLESLHATLGERFGVDQLRMTFAPSVELPQGHAAQYRFATSDGITRLTLNILAR